MAKRSDSAIFSLVSADSEDDEAEEMLQEALEVEYTANKGWQGEELSEGYEEDRKESTDGEEEGEEEGEEAEDRMSDTSEYAAGDDVQEELFDENESDLVDAGLAAAQDSVKTVITQSFRACAYAADSMASLVLKAHDLKSADEKQSAGASSSEIKVPPTTSMESAVSALEMEERRLSTQPRFQRALAVPPRPSPRGAMYSNVSSEAFASLFQDLDDSTFTFASNPTPPRRLPSDFQLALNSSSSESEMNVGTEKGHESPIVEEEDAPASDSDAYTEFSQEQQQRKQQQKGTPLVIEKSRNHLDEDGGIIQISIRTISNKLSKPIHLASSILFPSRSDGTPLSGIHTPLHSDQWGGYFSPLHTPYYFTPPITPFGNIRGGPPFKGLRTSFRKVSLGSFNSIKDAITGWRHSQRTVHSAEPVPDATTQQSGLFEDIEMFLLERVDLTFYAARHLAKKLKRKKFYIFQKLKRGSNHLIGNTPKDNDDDTDESFSSDQQPSGEARDWRRRKKSVKRNKSICSSLRALFSFDMPRNTFRRVKKTASSVVLSPFSFLDSATRRFVHLENVDELKGIGRIVHRQGYPFQELRVVTNDGYVLTLDRLPNPGSKKVAMLVHGVMDSSFTYICNGADSSLAYRLHDEGYDVYLTNFRGVGGTMAHRHVRPDISDNEFWDFSINEHAFEDIPCFVKAIVRTKMSEFSSNNDFVSKPSIVAVAHSMGGAVMLMYVLNQKEQKLRHYLDGLVLVSPAGIHSESPLYARWGGRAVDLTIAKAVNSLRLPTDALTRATVKLVQDIKNSVPALEDIISLVVVYALGGDRNQPRRGPFSAVQQLTYNVLTCGTSTKVYTHLRQFITSKQFRAFDYEPTAYPCHYTSKKGGNMEHYGTPEPPEYTSRYHMMDIPVHLIAGLDDQLIGPSNVLRHYDAMKRHGVDVTFESFERCGHADFTCGLHSRALQGILAAVNQTMDKILSKQSTLKELQRKKLITPHF